MRDWINTLKPAASRRLHLLLAALMWSIVGAVLAVVGARWLFRSGATWTRWLVLPAVVLGIVKSLFVLDKAAARIVNRINARGDGRCIGGFLSLRTWLLVGVMMGAGRLLRGGAISLVIVGFVYAAVGTALACSSRHMWRAWYVQ